jgi:hypothetical protein
VQKDFTFPTGIEKYETQNNGMHIFTTKTPPPPKKKKKKRGNIFIQNFFFLIV